MGESAKTQGIRAGGGGTRTGQGPWSRAWSHFWSRAPAKYSAVLLLALAVWVGAGPAWLGDKALRLTDANLSPPGAQHWFGTDLHGRDLLSRVLSGARISVAVGLVGAMVSLVIGVSVGAIAGYWGGKLDAILMRLVDALYALPSILLVIVLVAVLEDAAKASWGGSHAVEAGGWIRLLFLLGGLGAVSWLTMARVVRGQVLSIRERAFVEASRALGGGRWHVLRRHVLPQLSGVVLAYLMLTVPGIILYESFLSYLGLGIQPPHASLGTLIAEGAGQLNPIRISWWLLVFPGGMLVLTLALLQQVGDGLREAFDPKA